MKLKKNFRWALPTVAVVHIAIAIGAINLLFVPPPENVKANYPIFEAELNVEWLVGTPFDLQPTLDLLDINGAPIAGLSVIMDNNTSCDSYTASFTNVTEDAVSYRISWADVTLDWFNEGEPIQHNINWANPDEFRTTHSRNW